MLPDVIAKSSSSARCLCGGGPPPEPTTQSSANIEPPDSSPVTRNVYMSPGPHHERPVSPLVVCTAPVTTSATPRHSSASALPARWPQPIVPLGSTIRPADIATIAQDVPRKDGPMAAVA